MVCGPTLCGKIVFVKNFLKHIDSMSNVHFARIIVYYSEWQSIYKELENNIKFHEGVPKNSDFVDVHRPKLIIIENIKTFYTCESEIFIRCIL